MRPGKQRQNSIIVGAATIASDLHRIMRIASTVSLAAKNARIISAQAGEKARGFQPITRYITEITNTTLSSAEKVEQESVSLTRFASQHLKTLDSYRRYQQIFRDAADAEHIDTLRSAANACDTRLIEGRRLVAHHINVLKIYLEELNENMRAALSVAALCRIEASRAEEYRESLSTVSDDLETAARTIQEMLSEGMKRIDRIQDETTLSKGSLE